MRPESLNFLSCSVFRPELSRIVATHFPGAAVSYLDSALHMNPSLLGKKLKRLVERARDRRQRLVLVYGDCCPYLQQVLEDPRLGRTRSANCAQLLLGGEAYRHFARQGSFFLLPEWASRWRQIIATLMDMDEETTREMFRDAFHRLLYLDTGVQPVPRATLKTCSEHFGIPWTVHPVSLENMTRALFSAIPSW